MQILARSVSYCERKRSRCDPDINQHASDMPRMQHPVDVQAIHAVVFAGQDMTFTPQKRSRHDFGLKLIMTLSCHFKAHAAITQHAMLLWTIAMAKSVGHVSICLCVGCFMLANKIHDNSTSFSLLRFARACGSIPHCRSQLVRDLDAILKTEGEFMSVMAIDLKNQLKSIDILTSTDAKLVLEVGNITVGDLKCAETTLLFHVLKDRWNFYLFYIIEYVGDKLAHLPASGQIESIQKMCLL